MSSSPRPPAAVAAAVVRLLLVAGLGLGLSGSAAAGSYDFGGALTVTAGPDGVYGAPLVTSMDSASIVLDPTTGAIGGFEILSSSPLELEVAPSLTLTLSDLHISAGAGTMLLGSDGEQHFKLDPLVISATLSGMGSSQLVITEGYAKGGMVWSPEDGLVSLEGIGVGSFREVLSSLGGEAGSGDWEEFDLSLQVAFSTGTRSSGPGEAVPEPSAALVFALGFGTAAAWSRRPRR